MQGKTNNLVVFSDTHIGCRLGLINPNGTKLDDGGTYIPSKFQLKMWDMWYEFWEDWVPKTCQNEPYDVVFNGDALDGVHHNSTTQISHNLEDQKRMALNIFNVVVDKAEHYYHIRGTEAHVGQSAYAEESLARELGAIPNEEEQYARFDLWKAVGTQVKNPGLVHLLHHIGTTGSQSYEVTAVHKELTESFIEAGRWGHQPPDVIVRSHRHRHCETKITTARGTARAVVTPAWQGKTPFVWKIPGGRLSQPQFGGIVIRQASDGILYIREKVWTLAPTKTE